MKIEVSQVIDRPPAVVFRFIVVDHVRNHPRWDPKMELQQVSEGPIRVGDDHPEATYPHWCPH